MVDKVLRLSFDTKQASRDVQKFANDTGKALDPKKVVALEDKRGKLLAKKRQVGKELKLIRKQYDK